MKPFQESITRVVKSKLYLIPKTPHTMFLRESMVLKLRNHGSHGVKVMVATSIHTITTKISTFKPTRLTSFLVTHVIFSTAKISILTSATTVEAQ
jgi:hypothetical protein